ncbi:MAG: hypothetical protein ACM3SS_24975 [Rhodospirillaceae bacterium]
MESRSTSLRSSRPLCQQSASRPSLPKSDPRGPKAFRRVASTAVVIVFCSAGLRPSASFAYDLSPQGTALEQSVARRYYNWWEDLVAKLVERGLPHFKQPVHEEITQRILGCNGDPDLCGNPDAGFASAYVIAGVRWNDDPPFRLEQDEGRGTSCKVTETIRFTTQPKCWYELFSDAKKKAASGEKLDAKSRTSLLGRSHFGDLQFIHAMASADGEPANVTKEKIMTWAEFTWNVATGQVGLDAKLRDAKPASLKTFFGNTEWTVQDLFTLGNPALRRQIKEVALGSLLHMVEDSFAGGHAQRGETLNGKTCPGNSDHTHPGVIERFHSYGKQDPKKHSAYDARTAFSNHWTKSNPNVIDVGRTLVAYWEKGSPWIDVRAYVDCVFTLANDSEKAFAGAGFEKD